MMVTVNWWGEMERAAREFLGPRADTVPESVYLKAVTDLVRSREQLEAAIAANKKRSA